MKIANILERKKILYAADMRHHETIITNNLYAWKVSKWLKLNY
jgi:hypothetical protein